MDKPTKRTKMISVRASEEEIARVKLFAKGLISKYPYMKEADVLRELLSLVDTGVITEEMRRSLSISNGENFNDNRSTEPEIIEERGRIVGRSPKIVKSKR